MKILLLDKYKDYKEEPKKITWVYPDMVYPKNDLLKNKDIPIQDLIKASNKQKFNLQIFEMKYKEGEIIGFIFKFIEINNKKINKNELSLKKFIPSFKNEINFDLLNLNYIRTIIVKNKSGLRNLRGKEDNENNNFREKSIERKRKRKRHITDSEIEELSEEEKVEIILTKERILELQARDYNSIKSFINILPFYGNDISLVKHRPSKEQYPCGKAQEPLIKIVSSNFTKRINEKLKENPSLFKKVKNKLTKVKENESKIEENEIKSSFISSVVNQNENINNNEIEDINQDSFGDASKSLMNIFDIKSFSIIKFVDFFIYAFIIIIATIQFVLSYMFFIDNQKRFYYLSNSYKLLNDISYVKFYITEAILANVVPNYILFQELEESKYISIMKNELSNYRQEISNIINGFNIASFSFSKEFIDYISNVNITIKTLSNGIQKTESQPFSSAVNKLITSIFYISTIDEKERIDMNNIYSYELMVNLLDGYYIPFENIILIMLTDLREKNKNCGVKNIIMLSVSLFVALIYLLIFWKIMSKLDNDREKPINLFLTIKKNIFEELKNSSENFSNKLLNKFFGVEENEEESQQDNTTNIKSTDINIAKFKALNEFKVINSNGNSFNILLASSFSRISNNGVSTENGL